MNIFPLASTRYCIQFDEAQVCHCLCSNKLSGWIAFSTAEMPAKLSLRGIRGRQAIVSLSNRARAAAKRAAKVEAENAHLRKRLFGSLRPMRADESKLFSDRGRGRGRSSCQRVGRRLNGCKIIVTGRTHTRKQILLPLIESEIQNST